LKAEIKELKELVEKYQVHIEKLQTELYTLRSQMNPDRPAL
jgi:capsule polysaccharide export protein KpsE/RkpR